MFILYFTQILGLYAIWHERASGGMKCALTSTIAKWAVKAIQALSERDPSRFCELDGHVTDDDSGWDLWQQLAGHLP